MTILVMLNGPPRAGKDTATAAIVEAVGMPVRVLKATEPIKDETHRRLGLDCAHDAYEALKDAPLHGYDDTCVRSIITDTRRNVHPNIRARSTSSRWQPLVPAFCEERAGR